MRVKKIIIGTRGSKLALVQTNIVKALLEKVYPDLSVETKIITTTGDINMKSVPLDTVGKGWFTKELDKALLDGSIDVAVHSLKDIPEELPEGLVIAAIPEREDARDALVSKNNVPFAKLKKGAVIGTDSNRRKTQILHKRPDLIVESIRGNVNTRLDKLDKGEYDAIALAVAGLKRLGLEGRISEYFPVSEIIPSPGQGALAIVCRESDKSHVRLLKKLNHEQTVMTVLSERSFSKIFGGGCKLPVGAYAQISTNRITLLGFVGSLDGKYLEQDSISGEQGSFATVGKMLAKRLQKKSKAWERNVSKKYVVLTRPTGKNNLLKTQLENSGLRVLSYPTIAVKKSVLTKAEQKKIIALPSFDWILFTSAYGVNFFMQTIADLKIDLQSLSKVKIGVVGPKTATAARKFGLSVAITPQEFTTENLGKSLHNVAGKKFFLPRADIATETLPNLLRRKGAEVVEIPIYKTGLVTSSNKRFAQLLTDDQIACLTFTSPSTVIGFLRRFSARSLVAKVLLLPVVVIGPVTAKAAKEHGFLNVFVAKEYTIEGLAEKVEEILV
jgi:hydroxymethylbilane synthase